MAKMTIDGKEHEFEDGMNLFEACAVARGENLPHFCYHPGLSIAGVCRMCQVEVEGMPKLMIACNSQVKDGMVVHTRNERVDGAVRQILNFHLLHHPVDCPVCDQAGECSLQDFYMANGLYEADVDIEDKIAKGKVKPIGEMVMLDAERCVLCARCTRFTTEITQTHEMGIFNRGDHSEIDVAPGKTLDNNYSLNTVDICPVGALTSRDFRFRRRVWWLSETDGICHGCATGCNMSIHHSEGIVYRTKPRDNMDVNRYWMCDHGRTLYHEIAESDRLTQPSVRKARGELAQTASWDHAYRSIEAAGKALGGDDAALMIILSPHATVEELYAAKSVLSDSVGGALLGYRLRGSEIGEGDELLFDADRTPNAAGAKKLGLAEYDAKQLEAAANEKTMLLVVGGDLALAAPDAGAALSKFGCVVYLGWQENSTSMLADIVLPTSHYAEREGTFVNREGRAQTFAAAIDAPGEARDPLRVIRELGALFGHEPTWDGIEAVRSELCAREGAFAAMAQGVGPLGLALDAAAESEVERA